MTTETTHAESKKTSNENVWVHRFEELLKVKNLDDLKGELTKLAGDLQGEIQSFDLNAHLSPSAKARLRELEGRYNQVMRSVSKAQKEFDREFNRSIRVLKSTRDDAAKQLNLIKSKITKHRSTIVKASTKLKTKVKTATTKKKASKKSGRRTTKKSAK